MSSIQVFSVLQMENELERYHKQNTQLELNIDELRQKLKSAEKETLKERQKVWFLLTIAHYCYVTKCYINFALVF